MRRIPPTRRILDVAGEWGILSIGFYHTHLSEWIARYGRESLLVLLYEEDVVGDKRATMRRVFEHLGVDPDFEPAEAPRYVVVNPPYGERIGSGEDLYESWVQLGNFLHTRCRGATAHVTKIPPEGVLRQLIHTHTAQKQVA